MIYLAAACICASLIALLIEGVRRERKVQELKDALEDCHNGRH